MADDGDDDDDGNDDEDDDEDENIDYHRNQVLPMICTLGSKPQGKILVLHELKCHSLQCTYTYTYVTSKHA